MLLLHIINLYFFTSALAGIVCRKPSGFFKCGIRKLGSAGFYNYMGTGSFFRVESPVISGSKMEGKLFILQIIFSYINMKAVAGNIMKRFASGLPFLSA